MEMARHYSKISVLGVFRQAFRLCLGYRVRIVRDIRKAGSGPQISSAVSIREMVNWPNRMDMLYNAGFLRETITL